MHNKSKKAYVSTKATKKSENSTLSELSLEEQLELFAEILIDHVLSECNEQTNP